MSAAFFVESGPGVLRDAAAHSGAAHGNGPARSACSRRPRPLAALTLLPALLVPLSVAAAPGDVFNCRVDALYRFPVAPETEAGVDAPAATEPDRTLVGEPPRVRHFMVSRGDGRAWADTGPLVPEFWSVEVVDPDDDAPYHALMQGAGGALSVFSVRRDQPLDAESPRPLFRRFPASWLDADGLRLGECRLVPAAMQE